MKRSWGTWTLGAALLLGVAPAAGTVVPPSATWQNPGNLYADAVLMTSYADEVALSPAGDSPDPSISLEALERDYPAFPAVAFWAIPSPVTAGEVFVTLDEPDSVYAPEPLQVELFEEELGPQPFVPHASLALTVEETAPILCCDAWADAVAGLRESLPSELIGLLVPPGQHSSCLMVSDSSLRLDIHLDEVTRAGASSPYSYEVTARYEDGVGGLFVSQGPYDLPLPATWLGLGAEACVVLERTDWRDEAVEEFRVCPVDFAAEFPAVSRPGAVLPPVQLPSPVDCSLDASSTLDASGNPRALSTSEWCSIIRPRCEVYENLTGPGRLVHPEDVEAACAPCADFYQIGWDDLNEGEATDQSEGGCAWSPPRSRSHASYGYWLLLLVAALVGRASL